MTPDTEGAIQVTYSNIAKIFRDADSSRSSAKSNSLIQLPGILNAEGTEETIDPNSELRPDSLEKVSFYIDLALNTFESIQGQQLNPEQRVSFIFALSETHETLGNYQRALTNYETALNSCMSAKNRPMQGQIQYRMARIYSDMGKWDKAEELLNEAILALQVAANDREVPLAQIELAKIAFRRGRYSAAESMFEEAIGSAEEVNDLRARAVISNHLGVIRRMEGKYDLAYLRFQEALLEFQGMQDFRGTADSLNNLGLLHMLRSERREAIGYFDKALQLCQEVGYFPLLPFVYLNKTEYYCEEQDYPMAANTCGRALESLKRLRNPIGIAKTTMLFGRIFWKSGDLAISQQFYKESIRLYQEFDIPFGLANCCLEFAQMLKHKGDAKKSSELQTKGQHILDQLRGQQDQEDGQQKVKVVERTIAAEETISE
ncbi:tetratricopeptide repeat protein [bacterium]|nr:tetratricopeptide repeat protein [bacterium]